MSEVKVNKISPRTNCGTVTVGDAGDSVTVTAGVPVTVNGDLKSNALKAVDGGSIISQCGTNITLGASGDTINLAAGASQTGFGRTGTVDWDTTAKTASFTAVSGNGYFVNTTSGAITVTLPASPSAGDIVYVKDYTGTFDNNACTVARNGSNIRGATNNFTLEKSNSGAVFIYVDATEGWQVFVDGSDGDAAVQYICASGGTITCCGDYRIHTFTGPGTFTVNCISCSSPQNTVSYMVVAGGGGSGISYGGGGGAGGFREYKSSADCYTASPLNGNPGGTAVTVTAQPYPITVGGGGTASFPGAGSPGANSVFSTITSTGGGLGGSYSSPAPSNGSPGGSGGGSADGPVSGGNGNTPPVSPPQGNNGGNSSGPGPAAAGGGATAVGGNNPAGNGGAGATTSISGTPTAYAGGGGGAGGPGGAGSGGIGGGGNGATCGVGTNGTTNTGGGAGGSIGTSGANGGSGIVIIRYKYQ